MTTLVVRLGAIGDTVLTLLALESLRDQFPGDRLILVGGSAAAALFVDMPWIQVIPYDSSEAVALFADDWLADGRFLAATGPIDRAYVLTQQIAPIVAALDRMGIPATGIAPLPPAFAPHVADHLALAVGGAAGGVPRLDLSTERRARVAADLRSWGIRGQPTWLLPGAGGAWKRWPVQRFAEVADRVENPVVLAGPADRQAFDAFASLRPGVPAIDTVPLVDLAAALRLGRAVVANDSGPAHIAAAVGVPTVVIFVATDPARWAPRGAFVLTGDATADTVIGALE